ncbi:MAG: GNAT family N-acetyltransferase [Candidatus Njordarchaeia archaeon]
MFLSNKPIGFARYAPTSFFENLREYPVKSSDETVFLSCLYIVDGFRGRGYGSILLKSVISELKDRGMVSVETIARRGSDDNPSGPLEFYLKNGFKVLKEHVEFPLVGEKLY